MKFKYSIINIGYIELMSKLPMARLFTGIKPMANEKTVKNARPAPDFPAGAEWINTNRPLVMPELRGRVVLLDFWTYACINCMHVLPDLAKLEQKYGDTLVVVGVHSAKFVGEKDTGNIREAVKRYNIRHPVINDPGLSMWKELGIRAWPTLVLIDPEGNIVGKASGEGNYDVLDRAISDLLEGFTVSEEGLSPLPIAPEADRMEEMLLKYPGKVLADPERDHLFIADSGHNRIVVAGLTDGDVLYTIGSGQTGMRDGGFGDAEFSNPQGMALDGPILYVADTDNHSLRAIDLDSRSVSTVAGTGEQAAWGSRGGRGEHTLLNSPWDVTMLGGKLYVAMAGSHQLWRYDPESKRIEAYAGSGREGIVDGPLTSAELAQPSGITSDGMALYFADSEASAIRKVAEEKVITLIGKGLFIFGFQDGTFPAALLQHPLGVVYDDGRLWVADTYNNCLRRMNLADMTIVTTAGAREDGFEDGVGGNARFDEPGGLTIAHGKVYIADTNNHAVRIFDPLIGNVTTYNLVETLSIIAGGASFQVQVLPPEGYHINTDAPSHLDAREMGQEHTLDKMQNVRGEELRASFQYKEGAPERVYEFSGELYLCREGEKSICTAQDVSFRRKIRVDASAAGEPVITYTAPHIQAEAYEPLIARR
jgi:thiol-disulfide isomerase/thioredoxin/sugar lactone lactonase YvrE